jgi:hypothetical protein
MSLLGDMFLLVVEFVLDLNDCVANVNQQRDIKSVNRSRWSRAGVRPLKLKRLRQFLAQLRAEGVSHRLAGKESRKRISSDREA